MVKTIIMILALIAVIFLMSFDASIFYNKQTAFLYDDEIQALFHFALFFVLSLYLKSPKLVIVIAIAAELLQLFIGHRSFQMIDLLSNIVAILAAQKFIYNSYENKIHIPNDGYLDDSEF